MIEEFVRSMSGSLRTALGSGLAPSSHGATFDMSSFVQSLGATQRPLGGQPPSTTHNLAGMSTAGSGPTSLPQSSNTTQDVSLTDSYRPIMSRGIKNVTDLWKEYSRGWNGLPAVGKMYAGWLGWKMIDTERKFYSRSFENGSFSRYQTTLLRRNPCDPTTTRSSQRLCRSRVVW